MNGSPQAIRLVDHLDDSDNNDNQEGVLIDDNSVDNQEVVLIDDSNVDNEEVVFIDDSNVDSQEVVFIDDSNVDSEEVVLIDDNKVDNQEGVFIDDNSVDNQEVVFIDDSKVDGQDRSKRKQSCLLRYYPKADALSRPISNWGAARAKIDSKLDRLKFLKEREEEESRKKAAVDQQLLEEVIGVTARACASTFKTAAEERMQEVGTIEARINFMEEETSKAVKVGVLVLVTGSIQRSTTWTMARTKHLECMDQALEPPLIGEKKQQLRGGFKI